MLRLKKMALFSIDFKPSAEKDLHHLPRDIVLRAMEKIEDLNQTHFPANPSGYPAPKGFIVYELETTDHLRS
jgi:mRNA-degrading endonuclease RelE of RelBE toxin-antitoxin system